MGGEIYPVFASAYRAGNVKQALSDAIHAAGGNMRRASAMLGISRRTLYRKMDELGLNPDAMRNGNG
jgi:transcriptional regulator of acetoin/glycerol metabolism